MAAAKKFTRKWFHKHAVEVEFRDSKGKVTIFPAFLQPLRYKNKMYLSGSRSDLGFEAKSKFLMIYPAEIDLGEVTCDDVILLYSGYRYLFDKTESVYDGNEILYKWAVIQKGAVFVE